MLIIDNQAVSLADRNGGNMNLIGFLIPLSNGNIMSSRLKNPNSSRRENSIKRKYTIVHKQKCMMKNIWMAPSETIYSRIPVYI